MRKITVIVPVYNSELYLEKCINSILSQTYPVYEIILINDGSTDNSLKICEDFKNKDKRILLINQENGGVSKARNSGLEICSGDFVSFVDSDDVLELDMYEYLVSILDNHNADISHCGYKRLDEENHVLNECSGSHLVLEQNGTEAIDYMLRGKLFAGGLWNKLYKKSVIGDTRFEEELKNCEDILFNALVFQNAGTIVFGDETKYLYYEHSSSACNSLSATKKSSDSVLAAEKLLQESKSTQIHDLALKWLFLARLNIHKTFVVDSDKNNDMTENKKWLKQNYNKVYGIRRTDRINYYLSIYFSPVFKLVYNQYTKIRKSQWDPQK